MNAQHLRVVADGDMCIASGQCSRLAPTIFGHDESGVVRVLNDTPDDHEIESAAYAARICPAAAIDTITD